MLFIVLKKVIKYILNMMKKIIVLKKYKIQLLMLKNRIVKIHHVIYMIVNILNVLWIIVTILQGVVIPV